MKRKLLLICIAWILLLSVHCTGQEYAKHTVSILKDEIYKNDSKEFKIRELLKNGNSGKIIFGLYFKDDNAKMYCNDEIVFNENITTNPSIAIVDNHVSINTSKQNLMRLVLDGNEILFVYDNRFLFLEICKEEDDIKLIYHNNIIERS